MNLPGSPNLLGPGYIDLKIRKERSNARTPLLHFIMDHEHAPFPNDGIGIIHLYFEIIIDKTSFFRPNIPRKIWGNPLHDLKGVFNPKEPILSNGLTNIELDEYIHRRSDLSSQLKED